MPHNGTHEKVKNPICVY